MIETHRTIQTHWVPRMTQNWRPSPLIKALPLTATLAVLSACQISDGELKSFGQTAGETVEVVGLASSVTGDLIAQNVVTQNACRYIKGVSYTLAATPDTQLSPLLIDQQNIAIALDAYAKAIAGALDPETQGNIDTASEDLATSIGAFGEQVGAGAQVAPTVALLFNAIARIEETRRVSAVKAEMEKVFPFLLRLRELLAADQARALAEMDEQIAAWDRHTRCVLTATRQRANAEAAFRDADQARRDLISKRKQAARAVLALDALIDAHAAIVFGDGEFEDGLKILDAFVEDLQAIKDAKQGDE
ncbi:hypothetical protein QTO30_07805 [Yoonia sp. GPGPB17]|uniref:hypothetical protein n=1 Tax=Yoonia sp. GPGPB17 TaxID=3026147 RepID=UPI0030BD79A1